METDLQPIKQQPNAYTYHWASYIWNKQFKEYSNITCILYVYVYIYLHIHI